MDINHIDLLDNSIFRYLVERAIEEEIIILDGGDKHDKNFI